MDKQDKITRYRQLNQTAQKGQIVFAGSSLMEMFPIEQFVAEDNDARVFVRSRMRHRRLRDGRTADEPCCLRS